jgi:hypothetical protein
VQCPSEHRTGERTPVEARHAAWIRQLAHQSPAPAAFNPALTKSQVLAAVDGTGFIKA